MWIRTHYGSYINANRIFELFVQEIQLPRLPRSKYEIRADLGDSVDNGPRIVTVSEHTSKREAEEALKKLVHSFETP